jgi:hypothetical protein
MVLNNNNVNNIFKNYYIFPKIFQKMAYYFQNIEKHSHNTNHVNLAEQIACNKRLLVLMQSFNAVV